MLKAGGDILRRSLECLDTEGLAVRPYCREPFGLPREATDPGDYYLGLAEAQLGNPRHGTP
jgi:hypothetical protein